MITDPYQVLGLKRGASDDQIKKAYRDLSRKYHPDTNANNPLADLAEEKFKEVQEAYQQIVSEKENGGYSSSGFGQGYSSPNQNGQSSYGYGQEDPKMSAVINFINSGSYREALQVLSEISNRTPRWFYLNAVSHAGMGNNMEALNYAREAVNREPSNREYSEFLNRLQWSGQRYQNNSTGYGYRGSSCGTGNLCCDLCIADQLCECMGGDLCACM